MSREAEFLSPFFVRDIAEGKEVNKLQLEAPLRVYSAVLRDEIIVPEGFEFDGESIPVCLRWLVPPFGQSKRGACVHDYLYRFAGFHADDGRVISVSRAEADRVYRELIELKGLPTWRANVRWGVLRLVGWAAWNSNREKQPAP